MKEYSFANTLFDDDYSQILNSLLGKKEENGWIHVENERDKCFWIDVLGEDIVNNYEFTMSSGTDSVDDGVRGKARFYAYLNSASKTHVFAIDSDFSLLTPDTHNIHLSIIYNKYILHTYGYGKESIINCAENLNACLTKYKRTYNNSYCYNKFFTRYSNEIYKALLTYIFSMSYNSNRITRQEFYTAIKINTAAFFSSTSTEWDKTIKRIRAFNDKYDLSSHDDYPGFIKTAASFGLSNKTAYQFIDCHHLENAIVTPIDKQIRKNLINNALLEYKKTVTNGESVKQKFTELTNHFDECLKLDTLRNNLCQYKENSIFKLIEKQKENLVQLH
ncbi:hypothetical protein [Aeromonas veronii]